MCERRVTRAADLAEWIVEELSRAGRDWRAIARRARQLSELAAGEGAGDGAGVRHRRALVGSDRRWPQRRSTRS
jgi:hypothetical protein